ncbi:hypothetical protein A2803_05130 [Candidatus Woesebacteria bacterium RIFCSPHIGHO2_01_FULL_44_21]|uniref:Toxin HicA n=1 Tax=Candidatus Woesebacteria bacterium RIFCSPHIGHO2_01_FULL_44_21 TaxID=1802503 RepID=A0A1F7Z095_9BACT|nr:MAG: hypothetical protein A2803_05130 [Candidatus Woesebacteria bacterium RIFCSPHIGHO2_01_FULL_44_21]OGM68932.1 MAG: hypothetical protein A2897_01845 [Candidatus Woesebacteria bacterium RIFCSPLOWO2_01_FULL_44_24b]
MKPRQLIKLLKKNGYVELRQVGSHLHLYNASLKVRVTVPVHNKDLKRKTLWSIIKQSKIKV